MGNPNLRQRTKEQGGNLMINQDWMRFESTGSVSDYLAYSGAKTEHGGVDTGSSTKESGTKDGADHCAYRYGAGSDTHRGL